MERVRALQRERAEWGRVPRIVHQIWIQGIDKVPARYDEARAHWKRQMRVEEWDGAELAEVVAHWMPELADWFPKQKYVMQSDIGRLALLAMVGGIYADMDYVPINEFERCLAHAEKPWKNHVFIIGCVAYVDVLNNAMLASSRGNPIWDELVVPALRKSTRPKEGVAYQVNTMLDVLETAGPDFWTALMPQMHLAKYGATILSNRQVHCNQFIWKESKRAPTKQEMDDMEAAGCFGYHWYDKSWNDGPVGFFADLLERKWFIGILLITLLASIYFISTTFVQFFGYRTVELPAAPAPPPQ